MSNEQERVRDRAAGVLLGIAAGDKIGGPVRMALCLAQSLLEQRAFGVDDVRARYLAWYRDDGFDTGPVAAEVFDRVVAGEEPETAVRAVDRKKGGLTAGCNPLHRTPPLAMAAFLPDAGLESCARADARITHYAEEAGGASAAGVALCRALIRGLAWPEACARAAANRDSLIAEAVLSPRPVSLRRDGYAPHVLAAAVYFVGASAGFEEALESAVDFAGPPNYCPVLAGAIAGARWGSRAIPGPDTGDALLKSVRMTAAALAEGWHCGSPQPE